MYTLLSQFFIINQLSLLAECMWLCVVVQLLSVEDVEKILDDTQEAVEYQQVRYICTRVNLLFTT